MGAPQLTFSAGGSKISRQPGFDFISVTFQADQQYQKFECRATKAGEDYGVGKGELVASFSSTQAGVERTFEIYDDYLLRGDGEYRISLFAQGMDGSWNDNHLYIPSGSDKYITADGMDYLCMSEHMAGYNGAWTGQQIDEAVRQVTNKDLPADGVKFADGQTFQQKYNAGQLTGPAGQDGKDGAQGEPGTPGRDGATGPAGRGITEVRYSSSTNLWTISYSDGSSDQIAGPAIPTQLSDLAEDTSHRTVTDTEKSSWNGKADKTYVDGLVGNINTMLDTINGEVV